MVFTDNHDGTVTVHGANQRLDESDLRTLLRAAEAGEESFLDKLTADREALAGER